MRNSHNITITRSDALTTDDDTTWSLPGAVVGFASWLLALGILALFPGAHARCGCGRRGPAFNHERQTVLQHYGYAINGRRDVWRALHVAVGVGQPSLFMTGESGHNSNRNQQ